MDILDPFDPTLFDDLPTFAGPPVCDSRAPYPGPQVWCCLGEGHTGPHSDGFKTVWEDTPSLDGLVSRGAA